MHPVMGCAERRISLTPSAGPQGVPWNLQIRPPTAHHAFERRVPIAATSPSTKVRPHISLGDQAIFVPTSGPSGGCRSDPSDPTRGLASHDTELVDALTAGLAPTQAPCPARANHVFRVPFSSPPT